jgi:hypothetical protein
VPKPGNGRLTERDNGHPFNVAAVGLAGMPQARPWSPMAANATI